MGKPAEEMTKDELIKAFIHQGECYESRIEDLKKIIELDKT